MNQKPNSLQQLLASNFERKKAAEKLALAQKLGGPAVNFINYYLKQLPNFNSSKKCFENINLIYYKIFGVYRYSDYNSFRRVLLRYLKNRSK